MTQAGKVEERQKLVNLISQWNQDHYDIFELSQPNEELEFHGVVRFYFQDKGEVVTKCIRVSSSATTEEVVQVLVEKFRPDMRMLTNNQYALYEVHVNGEERKLNTDESVLMVQLNWGNDVREGRFLLKREGVPTIAANEKEQQNFKRKLSKREKKEKKKQDKKGKENDSSVAEKLYTDMPESTFTRSISNPEAVMKRRRQQKVEKKLQQCRGQDGHGGTLKIYGETLKPDIPYKTLLLSTTDNVAYVIKEALEKYGLEKDIVPDDLNLVQVLVPPEVEYHGGTIGEERIMEDHECPLAIAMQYSQSKGTMLFHLKLKTDSRKGKHKKMRSISHDDLRYARDEPPVQKLPYLIELNPDGSDNPKGKIHRLNLKFTEVGCDRSMYIQILGPNIQPRHCVIGLTHNDGIVTVTPTSPESETYVNNQRVYETTTLQNGMTVRFGKLSIFRFLDPNFEEKMKKGQVPTEEAFQKRGMPGYGGKPPETNFDVDGRVETMDGASSRGSDRGHPQDDVQNSRSPHDQSFGSQPDERMMPPTQQQKHIEEALPAALEFRDEKEDAFLSAIILDGNNAAVQFKLSPTYILYMGVRYCLSNAYRPEMTPSDRALRITALVNKIANMTHQAIQTSRDNPAALAFWMANASEILHFYKQDHDIHPFSQDAQEMLAESVQMAFHHLVRCLQYDLQRTMPAFLDENDNAEDSETGMQEENRARYNRGNKPNLGDVLDTLSSAMNLLRRCRVNAALTIQLFSQLFHFINMWLFNILVANQRPHHFCTRSWGMRLKRRLGRIEAWAEKQGLELAADCHLCRIIQAAHLLQAPKSNPDDIADISSTCFKLNSLQLRELLQRYIPEPNEPPIPQNLIERIVAVAENMADDLAKTDGREVRLEEDPDLQLPFLLPEDGYSCDTIRGIPNGLGELIEPLARAGLCRMVAQPSSRGDWTVYMSNGDGPRIEEAVRKNQQGPQTPEPRPQPQLPKEPEVVSVTFNKVKGSMGLSIVAAKGDGQKERGIYIKSVVPSGAADIDGRLQAGDQLLEVDGKSLVGLTQEKAAELMTRTGQTVTLKVAKQGAFYHGLATLLSQPSPIMQRASPKKPASPMINKQRPQEEGPPPYNGTMDMDRRHLPGPHPARQAAMQSPHSRSSPSLNSDGTGSDRGRPTASARDLRDHHQSPHIQPSHPDRFQQREMDPKSKSIPNLRMDTSFEQKDPQHNMRPAASVGALQNAGQFHDYYNQRPDPRDVHGNDYENAPNVDPRFHKPHQDMRNDRGYPEGQNMPPGGQFGKPQHPMERGPPSSRTSSASVRDDRPHSAYFSNTQDRPVIRNERPVSMEVNPNRVEDWQHRYGMDENGFENRDPNYVNTLPSQMQNSGYVNQGDIPKLTANNESRQPNFYENTVARQQEPTPAFHQLRRPQSENDNKPRPAVAAKPFVAPKPTTPKVQPADIPRVDVNNKNSQPHFYDPRMQNEQRSPNSSVPSNYIPGRPLMTHSHSTGFNDPRMNKSMPGGREMYNTHLSPELPPPPNEIPPELPPPPSSDDLPEELPPLPPPPSTDYKPMQQADPQYVNHPLNPAFGGHHNYQYDQRENPKVIGYAGPQQQQANLHHSPPQTSTSLKVQMPQGYHPSNDYQNINYDSRPNRSFESQPQHSPGHVYETYDSKAQTLPTNYQTQVYDSKAQSLPANYQAPPHIQQQLQQNQMNNLQQNRNRLVSEMSELTNKFNKDGKNQSLVSPWDRDEKEKLQKMQEEEMSRLREHEINELESRSYLSPQEQDRLRKLRLEQEFQRRVQEVSGKDEDEEDSDSDITNNTQAGREFLIQTIQEDINKAQRRLEELNQRRLYEEYEREKDRMQRLERKLEIFEKEREERQQRLQKRQQKKQREQEEYQRKQRELREKQRAEYEEQKRLHMLEEEKLRQRKMEEQQRQKELERERLQELQAQRDAEEAALRAEARRREEEYRRQEMEQKERERREQQREIRVSEERKRLEQFANQNQGYQQYANLPPQSQSHYGMDKGGFAPPPPQRGSSYDVAGNRTNSNLRNSDVMQNNFSGSEGFRGLNAAGDRNQPEISTKKSVSFNTQLETLNRYSVTSEEDRTPHASQSSYRSSHSSTSSEPHSPHSMNSHPPFGHSGPITPNNVGNDTVFESTPPQNHVNLDVKYRTAENTPGVIGAQEIYRDPRNRIEAEKLQPKKPGPERMSFRDKMKYFAQESGESTIKNRPKASKALRQIESQLHNGQ